MICFCLLVQHGHASVATLYGRVRRVLQPSFDFVPLPLEVSIKSSDHKSLDVVLLPVIEDWCSAISWNEAVWTSVLSVSLLFGFCILSITYNSCVFLLLLMCLRVALSHPLPFSSVGTFCCDWPHVSGEAGGHGREPIFFRFSSLQCGNQSGDRD